MSVSHIDYKNVQKTQEVLNAWENDVKLDIASRQLKAGDMAKSVASYAMGKDANVSWASRQKRRRVADDKKKLQSRASEMVKTGQPSWKENYTSKGLSDDIEALSTTRDFLAFRNDDTFLDYYNENYTELDRLSKIGTSITDTLTSKPAALEDEEKEKIKAEIKKNADIKKYYDTKLQLIKSPYYPILKKSDMDSMTDRELDARIAELKRNLGEEAEIYKYFVASKTLRNLEKSGVAREEGDALAEGAVGKREIKGGTSKRHKGYIEFLPGKLDVDGTIGADLLGWGKTWKAKKDDNNSTEEKTTPETKEDEKEDTKSAFDKETTASVFKKHPKDWKLEIYGGADVTGAVKAKLGKGSYKYKRKYFEVGGNVSVGAVEGHGSAGASIGWNIDPDEENTVTGGVGFTGDANVDLVKARGKINAHYFSDGFADGDITIIGGDAKAELKGGSASANAFAQLGHVVVETSEGQKEASGLVLGLSAEASLASGTISGGVKILGVRIGASLTGKVGLVGGTVGVAATSGSISGEVGLLAGLGLTLKLDIDFSEVTDHFSKNLKAKFKKYLSNKFKGTVN